MWAVSASSVLEFRHELPSQGHSVDHDDRSVPAASLRVLAHDARVGFGTTTTTGASLRPTSRRPSEPAR